MRALAATLVVFALALAIVSVSDTYSVPPLPSLVGIDLRAGPWWIRIMPDGSGDIGYGSSDSAADLPAGTFDFVQVYRSLAPVVYSKEEIKRYQNAKKLLYRDLGI
jgi:hypothetical protein